MTDEQRRPVPRREIWPELPFVAGGFRVLWIVPIYQFAWTPHLGLAAVFTR